MKYTISPMMILHRHLSKSYKHIRSFTSSSAGLFNSKKDSSDGRPKEPNLKNKEDEILDKETASNKLNDLLNLMMKKDADQPTKNVQLAQAVKHKKPKRERETPLGEKLENAAKDVATSLGGDTVKTESELLNILLRKDSTTQGLNDVLSGIKVQKDQPDSRAQQVRDSLSRQRQPLGRDGRALEEKSVSAQMMQQIRRPRKRMAAQVDLLGAESTTYFKGMKPQPPPCELRTWQACVERDMRLAVTHPPANIYEQMIQWTDRGMLWQFPLDNFQGLEEEKKVPFEEHILLENHLDDWCPEKGPVRHFMELVCVGLSKNHWLSAEEKRNHIFWFRDYFADKKSLIQEVGAGTINVEEGHKAELFKPLVPQLM